MTAATGSPEDAPPLAGCSRCGSSRSWTSCRAPISSVPSWKIITTDDRPSTDFERSVRRSGTPFIAFSSGTVTRLSTSPVERPGASVWISTSGGANSGNTSSGVFCAARDPATMRTSASATTTSRRRRERSTSQRIMGVAYFPAPNSTPNSSAAPSVTTRAPGAGPCDSTANGPLMSVTTTRCRVYTRGPVTT